MTRLERAWIGYGRAYQIYVEERARSIYQAKIYGEFRGYPWIKMYRYWRNGEGSKLNKKLLRAWELRCRAIKLRKEMNND